MERLQKEIDPARAKPITLILGLHDSMGLPYIQAQEQTLRRNIEACHNGSGRIYFVIENAAITDRESSLISEKVNSGLLPSTAVIASMLELDRKQPTPERVEYEKQRFFMANNSGEGRYHIDTLKMLDRVANDHQQKIGVVIEAHTPQKLEQLSRLKKSFDLSMQYGSEMFLKGKLREAVKAYKSGIKSLADVSIQRDLSLVAQIEDILKKDDSLGVVIQFGSSHSGINNLLQRKGFTTNVQYSKPDNYRLYRFNPTIRALKLVQERNPNVSWEELYLQDLVYSSLQRINLNWKIPFDEQLILRTLLRIPSESPACLEHLMHSMKGVSKAGEYDAAVLNFMGFNSSQDLRELFLDMQSQDEI